MASLCQCSLKTFKKKQSNTFIYVSATVELMSNKQNLYTVTVTQKQLSLLSEINNVAHEFIHILMEIWFYLQLEPGSWRIDAEAASQVIVSLSSKHSETIFFSL